MWTGGAPGGVEEAPDGCGMASCWEPWEEKTATHWSYVGRGRGDFEPVRTYGYVGRGAGSFQKETLTAPRGWILKPWCFALFGFMAITACVHLYTRPRTAAGSSAELAPAREAIQQPHSARPHEPIIRPRFLCAAPPAPEAGIADGVPGSSASGPAALIGAAILEAVWSAVDSNGDGVANQTELDLCNQEKRISTRALWLLRTAAGAAGGPLPREGFAATLAKAGLLASPAGHELADAVATSAIEAAWIAASSSEDSRVSLGELKALLAKAWPKSGSKPGTALLTPREEEMLVEEDADGDGRLDSAEFRAGLARAGLVLFVPDERARSIVGAVAGEVLWSAADLPQDGRLGWTELNGLQQRHELARALQLPQDVVTGSGLPHDDFIAMVAEDGLASELVRTLTAKTKVSSDAADSSWALAMATPIHSWSSSKKSWCCENVGLGCAWTSAGLPYDCKGMPAKWSEEWPEARRAWCCQHGAAGPGCSTAEEAVPAAAL